MDEKMLEEILKDYQDELRELREVRRKNAERHSKMTEEELIQELTLSYEEVLKDATENGVTIGISPVDEDEE
jgi:adenylate cyclase